MKSSKDIIGNIINLYEAGDITSILNNSDELLAKFPDNATIHNLSLIHISEPTRPY